MRDAFVPSNQRLKNVKLKTLLFFPWATLFPHIFLHVTSLYDFVKYLLNTHCGKCAKIDETTHLDLTVPLNRTGSVSSLERAHYAGYRVQQESGLLQGSSGSLHTARYNQLM